MPDSQFVASEITAQLRTLPPGKLPSIHGAIKILIAKGVLESRPKSGLWRKGDQPESSVYVPKHSASALFQKFRQEILDGVHPWESPLLSIKYHEQSPDDPLPECR